MCVDYICCTTVPGRSSLLVGHDVNKTIPYFANVFTFIDY